MSECLCGHDEQDHSDDDGCKHSHCACSEYEEKAQ